MTDSHYSSPPSAAGQRRTLDDFVVRLDELRCGPRFGSGGQVIFRCPIHDDHNPSASMCETDDGKVLVWCHACGDETYFDQLRALLFDGVSGDYRPSAERLAKVKSRPPLRFEPSGKAEDDYFYWGFDGTPLCKRRGRRIDPETGEVVFKKSFQWLRTVNGQWTTWREPTRAEVPMLYRSDLIASAETLYVPEGEKDANRLISLGIPAVSPSHGDNVWRKEWTEQLVNVPNIVVIADNDSGGRKHARRVAEALTTPTRSVPIKLAAEGKDVSDHLEAGRTMAELRDMPAASSGRFVKLSSFTQRSPSWFWRNYIPARRLTIIEGDPDQMKSTLTVDLVGRATKGRPMPDGTAGVGPMNVLIISAEDAPDDTILPRVKAAGGDPDRVFVLSVDDDRLLSFPDDTAELEEFIRANNIGLVVLDPLNAFLSDSVKSGVDHSVRRALVPMARLAQRLNVTVLVIRHLTKAANPNPLLRGQGSIAFIGAVRSGLLVASKPDDPELRYLALVKHNLTAQQPSWTFRPVADGGTVRIKWEKATDEVSAADLMAVPDSAADREESDELAELLRLIVTNGGGEIPANDGMKQLHANGAKPAASTLYRARKRAGIKAHKAGFGGGWVWSYHPAEDSTKNPKNPKNPGSGEMESTESSATPVESSGDPASVDEPGETDTSAPVGSSRLHTDPTESPEPSSSELTQSDQSGRYQPTGADREPNSDPVVLHLADVTLIAPKPVRDMSPEDHEAYGKAMREAALGPDPDGTEEP